MKRVLWLAAGFVCIAAILAVGNPRKVGWIDRIDGEPGDYELLRDRRHVPLSKGQPVDVQDGDRVRVLRQGGKIWIVRRDTMKVEELGYTREAYVIRRLDVPTPMKNVMSWGVRLLVGLDEVERLGSPGTVATRGDESGISIPLLQNGFANVVAGQRPLFLSWEGGSPPYQVDVRRQTESNLVAGLNGLPISRTRLDSVALRPGQYIFRVQDAKGREAEQRFSVVTAESLPAVPDELGGVSSPDSLRAIVFAAWLSNRDDGRWVLEAYQRVAPLAGTHYSAVLLRDSLEKGDIPGGASNE